MRECAVVLRNHAAVSEHDAVTIDRQHLNQFAVDEALADGIGLQ